MDKDVFYNELKEKAKQIGIEIKKQELEKFYEYMQLLLEWNEKINLTAITEPKEIILKHFIDSITINKYLKNKQNILDIGTGAGFPGIPLKIINKDKSFVLVDSLNKRIQFINTICKELKLEKIECIHARAEELAINDLHREKYDVITSRAVAKLNTLLEYMLPFVKIGGKCICMKGANTKEEIEEAKKAISILGGTIEEIETFCLPYTDIERNIIIIRKENPTPKKYPRKAGTPSKQPIV